MHTTKSKSLARQASGYKAIVRLQRIVILATLSEQKSMPTACSKALAEQASGYKAIIRMRRKVFCCTSPA